MRKHEPRNPFGGWFNASAHPLTISHGFEKYAAAAEDHATDTALRWVIPAFQRDLVWTEAQAVRFIESIWAGLPLASYVYDQSQEGVWSMTLLDGQQRWNAILRYVRSEFRVHGKLWNELELRYRRLFMNKPFSAYVTQDLTEAEQIDVYERLAYGGTPHGINPNHVRVLEKVKEGAYYGKRLSLTEPDRLALCDLVKALKAFGGLQ